MNPTAQPDLKYPPLRLVHDATSTDDLAVTSSAPTGGRFVIAGVPLNSMVLDDEGRAARAEVVVAFDLAADMCTAFTVTVGPATPADAAGLASQVAADGVEFFVRDYHFQDERAWVDMTSAAGSAFTFDLPPEAYEDGFLVGDPLEDDEDVIQSWFDPDDTFTAAQVHHEVGAALANHRECIAAVTAAYVQMKEEQIS